MRGRRLILVAAARTMRGGSAIHREGYGIAW
jgi:hypothetical protein